MDCCNSAAILSWRAPINSDFKAFAEDLENVKVFEVCINQDGEFYVPNEKDGRIARVEAQRGRLREFLLALCERLQCPEHAASEPRKNQDKPDRKRATA